MPSKIVFTPETILTHAFEIVKREGLKNLSARRVAQELGCSTQPIYKSYRSMPDLEAAVIEKAKVYALAYFSKEVGTSTSPFLSFGLRYFQFAQEEQALFELLFLDGLIGISLENIGQPFNSLLDGLRNDPELQSLSEESLKRIGTNMWIYLHGLTTLVYKNPTAQTKRFIREKLLQMGSTLIEAERRA